MVAQQFEAASDSELHITSLTAVDNIVNRPRKTAPSSEMQKI